MRAIAAERGEVGDKITVPMAPVKFSMMMVSVSAGTLGPMSASQEKVRLETSCNIPPIHKLVTSGSARATSPPAKPPISAAASPTPLTTAA